VIREARPGVNHPKRLRLGPVIDSGDDPTAPAPSIPFRLAPIVCESLPGWVDSVKTDLKRRRDPNADALFDLEADIPTNVHRFTRRLQRTACQLFQFAVQFDLLYAVYAALKPAEAFVTAGPAAFYCHLMVCPKPLGQTEAMTQLLGILEGTHTLGALRRVADAIMSVLSDGVLPKESGGLKAFGDLTPHLHPLIRHLRQQCYAEDLAHMREIRDHLYGSTAKKLPYVTQRLRGFFRDGTNQCRAFADPGGLHTLSPDSLSRAVLVDGCTYRGEWWVEEDGTKDTQALRHEGACDQWPDCVRHTRFHIAASYRQPTGRSAHPELLHTNLYGLAAPDNAADWQLVPSALLYRLLLEQGGTRTSRKALLEAFVAIWPGDDTPEKRKALQRRFDGALETLLFSHVVQIRSGDISIRR